MQDNWVLDSFQEIRLAKAGMVNKELLCKYLNDAVNLLPLRSFRETNFFFLLYILNHCLSLYLSFTLLRGASAFKKKFFFFFYYNKFRQPLVSIPPLSLITKTSLNVVVKQHTELHTKKGVFYCT